MRANRRFTYAQAKLGMPKIQRIFEHSKIGDF